MLNSISIKKIKGIEDKNFILNLYPNKPSLLVAPNGFGKSSFAVAFDSLNSARIDLKEKNFYKKQENEDIEIGLVLDSTRYTANASENEFASILDILVIKNSVFPKGKGHWQGNVTASLEIEPVTLIETIPAKAEISYSISNIRKTFGINGKILSSAEDILSNPIFWDLFDKTFDIDDFSRKTFFEKPILKEIDSINEQHGRADDVKMWIESNVLPNLKKIDLLHNLVDIITKIQNIDVLEGYLLALQFVFIPKDRKFKNTLRYNLYLKEKEFFDNKIKCFNTAEHHLISSKEKQKGQSGKKSLVISFPKADDISNGERDILSFISQLWKAERKLKKSKCILIIDEIFDYLDDANLIAFQYHIVQFIKKFKGGGRELYPILLTHLDPYYFKAYCFDSHKLQIRFLNKRRGRPQSKFLKLVEIRDTAEDDLKEIMSQYWFHYFYRSKNMENEFEEFGLNKNWGISHDFYKVIFNEAGKYLNNKNYDAIAVLLAVRIKIEKNIYNKLNTDEDRNNFQNEHKTINKLDFAVNKDIDVPEIYYLLGILHNQYLHWTPDRDYETPIMSKLNNMVIRNLIQEIFA